MEKIVSAPQTIAKNWSAVLMSSIGGFELVVKGLVNIGKANNAPQLLMEGNTAFSYVLKLNLVDVSSTLIDQNFQKIQYNQKIFKRITYNSIEIYHEGQRIADIFITKL